MRLYQVVKLDDDREAYRPTDETFTKAADFKRAVKKDGAKYAGCSWILLSEKGKSAIIPVIEDKTVQYRCM